MARDLSPVTLPAHLVITGSQSVDVAIPHWINTHGPLALRHQPLLWLVPPTDAIPIETVREVLETTGYALATGEVRVIVLPNLDAASIPAQNALLKLVEEPPAGYGLILTARHLNPVVETLRSRCQLVYIDQTQLKDTALDQKLAVWLETAKTAPAWKCIDLAGQFEDRAEAMAAMEAISRWLATQAPTPSNLRDRQTILKAYQRLRTNVTVKLALESACFRLSGVVGAG